MILVKSIDQYNENNTFFCDPIKNTVMANGNFIRILYSTPNVALNGIYLYFNINDVTYEKYYNKYKCVFNINSHKNLIEKLKMIEKNILNSVNIKNKTPEYIIYDIIKTGTIKIFINNFPKNPNNVFILKIVGIWETELNYGVTYKFMKEF